MRVEGVSQSADVGKKLQDAHLTPESLCAGGMGELAHSLGFTGYTTRGALCFLMLLLFTEYHLYLPVTFFKTFGLLTIHATNIMI